MNRSFQRGFTLLEILVVMVLTAMITTILLQGLHQIFRVHTHFGAETFRAQEGAMRIEWFRHSINGLMPDYEDGGNKFKGGPRQISGLTIAPLDGIVGALQPFVWRIEFSPEIGETILYYGANEEAPRVMSWAGNQGSFVFIDAEGKPHEEWPPFLGSHSQIPSLITLETGGRRIVALPRGPEKPEPRLREILDMK